MRGLRFVVIFCVFLIQRVTSQTCNCQSDLYISIDDLMKALNNGPGIPGLIDSNQGSCGCQPSQPQFNQQCGCQPTCQISNQASCNSQPSFNQPCGCQPQQKLVLGQPTFSISGVNLGNQCGCQPSIQISQPTQKSQQCNCQSQQCTCQQSQPIISNPSISFQPVGQSQAKPQIKSESVPSCIVPAALLQAPPYGIIFAGDNLLIDGAVQVCGNMPFNSIIELGGIVPSSGSGYVQYSCGDTCSLS